jgi:hypothetical protein
MFPALFLPKRNNDKGEAIEEEPNKFDEIWDMYSILFNIFCDKDYTKMKHTNEITIEEVFLHLSFLEAEIKNKK